HELAGVLQTQGDLESAEQTYERVLAIEARIYGSRDHYSTCMTELALASLLLKRGQRERAAALLEHAHPILSRLLGSAHGWVKYADRLLAAARAVPPPAKLLG